MIQERLAQDLKEAMRARDAVRLRTIRSIRAALQEREIEARTGGDAALGDDDVLAVLQKQAKQRRDAMDQYHAAGRDDLAAGEEAELAVIESYLPQQLGDDEIRKVLHRLIAATGAAGPRDLGKVMGAAVKELRGRADGRRINEIARALLTE